MAIIKVPRLTQPPSNASRAPQDEGLAAFGTEPTGSRPVENDDTDVSERRRSRWWPLFGIAAVGVIAAAAPSLVDGRWSIDLFADAPVPATLTLKTMPEGASISVDGAPRGNTPLSLTLPAGTYQVSLTSPGGHERTLQVVLGEGQSMIQEIQWASSAAPAAVTTGALQVHTDPAGGIVFVNDVRRGVAPVTVSDLPEGTHRLLVTSDTGSYRRDVAITAGETLSVMVVPQAAAVSAGFLRVDSPVLLQLRTGGDLIGNSESERVLLPAGEHEIEMSNEALGFRRTQRVRVAAGRMADLRVDVPDGLLSINAVPWADVWLNDERLGQTPLANIPRPIGTYRVTLRHPQFGEKRASITVTARGTARLGVDMRQSQ